jgi:hypothetical protein
MITSCQNQQTTNTTRLKLEEEIQPTTPTATDHSLMYVELGLFYWALEC